MVNSVQSLQHVFLYILTAFIETFLILQLFDRLGGQGSEYVSQHEYEKEYEKHYSRTKTTPKTIQMKTCYQAIANHPLRTRMLKTRMRSLGAKTSRCYNRTLVKMTTSVLVTNCKRVID